MSKHAIAIARAIGVIGATTAVIVGISFASETSNQVAISPNNLVSASANLSIASGSCPGSATTQIGGFTTATPLVPGGPAATVSFCLINNGQVPLTITASVTGPPAGTAANNTQLGISCTNMGGVANNNQTLSSFAATAFNNALAAGADDNCTASAALLNTYTGSGGEAIPEFDIDFIGNE